MTRTGRTVFALLVLLVFAPGARAQPAQIGGPLPAQLFPATNWWNLVVTGFSIDMANNATWHGAPNGNNPLHPDWGGDVMPAPFTYGIPYITLPGTQLMVVMDSTQFDYPEQSDYQAVGRPPGYPIPPEAVTQPHWIEGGSPGNTDLGNDQHMLMYDRDNQILFELYHVYYTGGQWHAGSGAIWPLNSNMRRPDGWTSADASGIQLLPGLVRYDEVFGPNPISHAFRYTVSPVQNAHIYPASHTACNPCNANSPPLGARIRLKNTFNIAGFEPHVQKVLQAMKTYGMIMTDGGTSMYVTGDYNTHWNDFVNGVSGATWLETFHDQWISTNGGGNPTNGVHLADFEYIVDPGGTQATGNDRLLLNSVSPTTKCQGNAGFQLTVNAGAGTFVNGMMVKFNGSARTTTFMNSGQLQAAILASDIVTAGDALVSVTNGSDPDMAPLRFTITADGVLPVVTAPAAATTIQTLCQ